jgi:hypothetical protein
MQATFAEAKRFFLAKMVQIKRQIILVISYYIGEEEARVRQLEMLE